MTTEVDIPEDDIWSRAPELLSILLKDHTLSSPSEQANIFWATDDYAHLGKGYQYHDPITPPLITGTHGNVIQPRILKHRDLQAARSKDMAEVFTPLWICNSQNNFIAINNRIGLLDRKLRIVSENTTNSSERLVMAQEAYKNITHPSKS